MAHRTTTAEALPVPSYVITSPPVMPISDSAAIINMIDRMSARPDIPVERIEQLFAQYQKIEAHQARKAYFAALSEMQPNLPIIEKKGTGHNSKYARWEDIVGQIMPVMAKYGFAISFRTSASDGKINITAILSHREGHAEETGLQLPADDSGKKNAIQAIGSTASYGKRYTACALLNIVCKDEDDDGKAGGTGELITPDQAEELAKLITDTKSDIHKFLALGNLDSLSDMPASQFAGAKRMLETKKRRPIQ